MKPKLAISLLVVLFVGPILVSWFLVNSDVEWAERGLSNHGVLIRPAIDLRDNPAMSVVFENLDLAPSEWAIINVTNGACIDECIELNERLQLIRSVIGSSRERLVVSSLAAEPVPDSNEAVLVEPAAVTELIRLLREADDNTALPQIVVLDWRRQMMLRFSVDAPSADIQKDLKKLLRASKIR